MKNLFLLCLEINCKYMQSSAGCKFGIGLTYSCVCSYLSEHKPKSSFKLPNDKCCAN